MAASPQRSWDDAPSALTASERQALRVTAGRAASSVDPPSPHGLGESAASPMRGDGSGGSVGRASPSRSGSRPRTAGKRNRKAVTFDKLVRAPPPSPAQGLPGAGWAPETEHTPGYLLYAAFEFKAHIKEEDALEQCKVKIDKLVVQLKRCPPVAEARGHLVFDIIATRKHIANLAPLLLGRQIYKVVEEKHFDTISTTFVGLTDNPACRVGRDIYARSEDLSPRKDWREFENIDNVRMMIVYP
eukprot:TRINITY_DN18398_c0_g1_i2.p1 TRINITY_DN18398_c0_g1~~TRINITY_DN18398_c0_g1_i2.p1  ORF type:complete len:280 (+),score=91.17 TRINITY_DN18398_c0_g1_i2:111-842(+)